MSDDEVYRRPSEIPYKNLNYPVDKIKTISQKLNLFVEQHTDILQNPIRKTLIYSIVPDFDLVNQEVPELKKLCDWVGAKPIRYMILQIKPKPAWHPGLDPYHIDPTPTRVNLLLPVRNCEGSITRFVDVPPRFFKKVWLEDRQKYQYDNLYKGLYREFKIAGEFELNNAYLFNAGYPHGVFCNPDIIEPRISFNVNFDDDVSHLLN